MNTVHENVSSKDGLSQEDYHQNHMNGTVATAVAKTEPESSEMMRQTVKFSKLPWGIWLLEKLKLCLFPTKRLVS